MNLSESSYTAQACIVCKLLRRERTTGGAHAESKSTLLVKCSVVVGDATVIYDLDASVIS